MTRFADQRKGGRKYSVKVTEGREGQTIATVTVTVIKTAHAKRAALDAAAFEADRMEIDPERMYAHSPIKAG